jgi:hypothetical protein
MTDFGCCRCLLLPAAAAAAVLLGACVHCALVPVLLLLHRGLKE